MDKMSKLGFNLKTRRSALRCVLALVLCLAMVTGFLPMPGMSALAAGNDIVVKFETDTAKEAGLQLSLYRVGDCENGDFHLYAESGVTLNSDEEDTDKIKAAVDELAAWAVSAQEPVRGPVAVDGKEVSFTGLDVGTYLIMPAGDHPTVNMQPSLVSLLGTKTVDAKIEEAVQVVVEKEWDEKDLTSLLDSESSITVQLFADDALYTAADGSYVEKTLPDTDSDGNLLWSYKQGNLPKYNKEKNEVKYEWREVETTIPTGYKLVSQETDDDTHTTTITNERETIDATVVKTWVHGTNAEDNYPTSIDVTLWKTVGGETTAVKTITLPVDGKWEYTESNLPLYEKTEEGTAKVTYKWTEDLDTIKVNGEALKEDENGNAYHQVEYNHDESTEGTVVDTYTNKYTDKTSYTITKTWDDASNQDGKRPDKIKVQLYYKVGDGAEKAYDKEPYNEPVELPADKDTVS
ncbi:MAG: Cna B-type domain-containing protein, partial [Clostridia bacterium]|nr:Cna B-type domain-containing protein [Clostridia bacterium]